MLARLAFVVLLVAVTGWSPKAVPTRASFLEAGTLGPMSGPAAKVQALPPAPTHVPSDKDIQAAAPVKMVAVAEAPHLPSAVSVPVADVPNSVEAALVNGGGAEADIATIEKQASVKRSASMLELKAATVVGTHKLDQGRKRVTKLMTNAKAMSTSTVKLTPEEAAGGSEDYRTDVELYDPEERARELVAAKQVEAEKAAAAAEADRVETVAEEAEVQAAGEEPTPEGQAEAEAVDPTTDMYRHDVEIGSDSPAPADSKIEADIQERDAAAAKVAEEEAARQAAIAAEQEAQERQSAVDEKIERMLAEADREKATRAQAKKDAEAAAKQAENDKYSYQIEIRDPDQKDWRHDVEIKEDSEAAANRKKLETLGWRDDIEIKGAEAPQVELTDEPIEPKEATPKKEYIQPEYQWNRDALLANLPTQDENKAAFLQLSLIPRFSDEATSFLEVSRTVKRAPLIVKHFLHLEPLEEIERTFREKQ
jgi:hypothetical protein